MKSLFVLLPMLFGSSAFGANLTKYSCWFRIGGGQNMECEQTFDLLVKSNRVQSVSKRICGLPYILDITGDYQEPSQISISFSRLNESDFVNTQASTAQKVFTLNAMDKMDDVQNGGVGIQLYCHR